MDTLKKALTLGISVVLGCSLMTSFANAKNYKKTPGSNIAKNIIFMVPDGQGLSNVTAARIFKNGPNGAPLHQETLEHIGYQRTHSANSTVTDSAAAATAWAIGLKANNGEISCARTESGDCTGAPKTILEHAKEMGKATGLVATSQISHATPAAFGAHAGNRYCGEEIARQYIEETGVDVVLGGGVYYTNSGDDRCPWATSLPGNGLGQDGIIASALSNGYVVVETESEMAALTNETKVLGLFKGFNEGKTVEYFRVDGEDITPYPADEPTLAEMTEAALGILEKDKDGFFLMVEGSQIDWEDHANNVNGMIAESLGFDAAVKVVLDWVNADSERKNHTLVIVAADHDTGGFAVNGPWGELSDTGELFGESNDYAGVPEAGWTSPEHTAVDTIIYSQGPGSERLNAAVDNTDLYYVMESVLH